MTPNLELRLRDIADLFVLLYSCGCAADMLVLSRCPIPPRAKTSCSCWYVQEASLRRQISMKVLISWISFGILGDFLFVSDFGAFPECNQ